jgi:fibronectin-binding autotransporter adhesin
MAVAFDASSESHTGTTGSTNQASFSWTHTPAGTPRGVLVYVFVANNATDLVQGVTYGGVNVPAVAGGAAVDTAGEPGRCTAFFLGSGIPTGAQSVVVSRTNTANIMYAVAITVTAATDTQVAGTTVIQGDGTLAVTSIDDGQTGNAPASMRFAGIYSGVASVPAAGTGSTALQSIDFGNYVVATYRETTAGVGARNVGATFASDDRAAVFLAVREEVAATSYTYAGTGGVTVGGAATTSAGSVLTYTYAGTGGVTVGGTGVTLLGNAYAGSGGVTVGGTGATSLTSIVSYPYAGSGGVTVGGSAGASLALGPLASSWWGTSYWNRSYWGPEYWGPLSTTISYPYAGTGGVTVGGAAATAKGRAYIGSGGVTVGGTAITLLGDAWAGSGGVTVGGAAVTLAIHNYPYAGSGGVTVGGAAVALLGDAYVGSGGVTVGGTAATSSGQGQQSWVYAGTGGVTVGGSAGVIWTDTDAYVGSGGVTVGGTALTLIGDAYVGVGGITVGGTALTSLSSVGSQSYVGSGGVTVDGTAGVARGRAYVGAGGVAIGGSAVTLLGDAWTGSGGVWVGGSASYELETLDTYTYAGSGGVTVGGEAVTYPGVGTPVVSGGRLRRWVQPFVS